MYCGRDPVDFEVVIAGGGLAGSVLAALLSRSGIHCLVLEPRQPGQTATPGWTDPRALAITPASRRVLEAVGVWKRLPTDRVGWFRGMQIWDENGGGRIEFDAMDIGASALGYIIEQSVLQAGLDQVVDFYPGISTDHQNRIQGWQEDTEGLSLTLSNGACVTTRLLVAADGRNSPTRQLAGIDYRLHDYRQQAVACVVRTEREHGRIARQRFLTRGPLAFLPMADAHQCGIVWSTTPGHAQDLLALEAEFFNRELETAFAQTLGRIEHSEARAAFPLGRAQAASYCGPRLALIGDAAHCVHPLAGQGANLGLLDSASLAEVVTAACHRHRDIGGRAVLRRYERWRRGENYLMMMVLEGFKHLFENQSTPVQRLRNSGMDLVDAMPFVKHRIMRRAMGLEGDLPAVARS